ncbi:MAG: hypothetical protein NC904_04780 [Candidatus Omnitrophica bacterium]|nr:hypothetical protein [Candidatus Omnitrophota bacterium]
MVTVRKYPLVTYEIYHIFNKSIAGYQIFNSEAEFKRMRDAFHYYCYVEEFKQRFSVADVDFKFERDVKGERLVKIIAYCIMPTHIHLIL